MLKPRAIVLILIVVAWCLAMTTLILTSNGKAMATNSQMVLFSHVEGTVTRDGEPVEGAEVVQKVLYKTEDEVPAATLTTGDSGTFIFEEIARKAPGRWLPGEVTITQSIVIHVDGQQYEGWHHGKKGFEANTELEGRPIRLVCELTTVPDVEGNHFGICREVTE